ncbi:MAG: hypothetical protein Aurels2KO_01650 [Aureliella sp.]
MPTQWSLGQKEWHPRVEAISVWTWLKFRIDLGQVVWDAHWITAADAWPSGVKAT